MEFVKWKIEEMLPPLIDNDIGEPAEDSDCSSTHPSDEMDVPEGISLDEILINYTMRFLRILSTGYAQVTTTFANVISTI